MGAPARSPDHVVPSWGVPRWGRGGQVSRVEGLSRQPQTSARKARAQASLEGPRADGLLCLTPAKTLPPATHHVPSTVSLSTAHTPLWLTSSLSLCPSFLLNCRIPLSSPRKAPESALGLWTFQPLPLSLFLLLLPVCLSVCRSVSLSRQAPPGPPWAVQWGPLLSPHRGGRSEHGAGGARQEAGDHGEAGRGKVPGDVQLRVTLSQSRTTPLHPPDNTLSHSSFSVGWARASPDCVCTQPYPRVSRKARISILHVCMCHEHACSAHV